MPAHCYTNIEIRSKHFISLLRWIFQFNFLKVIIFNISSYFQLVYFDYYWFWYIAYGLTDRNQHCGTSDCFQSSSWAHVDSIIRRANIDTIICMLYSENIHHLNVEIVCLTYQDSMDGCICLRRWKSPRHNDVLETSSTFVRLFYACPSSLQVY